jgi:hypothetical protein
MFCFVSILMKKQGVCQPLSDVTPKYFLMVSQEKLLEHSFLFHRTDIISSAYTYLPEIFLRVLPLKTRVEECTTASCSYRYRFRNLPLLPINPASSGKEDNIWKHLDIFVFLPLKSCPRIFQGFLVAIF